MLFYQRSAFIGFVNIIDPRGKNNLSVRKILFLEEKNNGCTEEIPRGSRYYDIN